MATRLTTTRPRSANYLLINRSAVIRAQLSLLPRSLIMLTSAVAEEAMTIQKYKKNRRNCRQLFPKRSLNSQNPCRTRLHVSTRTWPNRRKLKVLKDGSNGELRSIRRIRNLTELPRARKFPAEKGQPWIRNLRPIRHLLPMAVGINLCKIKTSSNPNRSHKPPTRT